MSEIRSQATPARDNAKNELATAVLELLNRAAQIGTPGRGITAHVVARGLRAKGWLKPRTVNSAAEFDALNPNAVCSFVDSNGITYACTAGEWQKGGFFLTIKPFPMITVHTHAESI